MAKPKDWVALFRLVTEDAVKVDPKWSNRDKARFHYHNPNGLYAAKVASDARVAAAVDAGLAKSGALLAHGVFNDYSVNRLIALSRKGSVGRIELAVVLEGIEYDIRKANEFLASLNAAEVK